MSDEPPHKTALSPENLFSTKGLVALVTGGGTGIGYMLAKALAHNGAFKIYIAGRRPDILTRAATSLGQNVIPLVCDVTSEASIKAAADVVADEVGYLNLLICNSGIGGPQVVNPTEETTVEEWAARNLAHGFGEYLRTFEVNTAAVWYTTMAFLTLLDKGNKAGNLKWSSQVVVTSSIGGFNKKAPGGWAYGQSKAATNLMVKQLAVVLPQWNIRANCICPGLFPSEMSAPIVQLYGSSLDEGDAVVPKEMVPMQRMGDEQDMAGAILYLASRAGAYCNGAVLVVDGGRIGNFPSIS